MRTPARFDSSLSQFIRRARATPPLSRERELELSQRWARHRDARAAEELSRAHLRYVVSVALKYRRYGVPIDELIAEGNFGLVRALQKFDPDRGNRFVTYAGYWIRAYVLAHVLSTWSMVRVGAMRSSIFFALRRERAKLRNLVGDNEEELIEGLSQRLNKTPDEIRRLISHVDQRDVSLDVKVFDDSATTLVDSLVDDATSQEEDVLESERIGGIRSRVREALGQLDPRERLIIEQRLMVDDSDELTLAELGKRLGVSRERIRQLESRAKRKLRQHLGAEPIPSAA